MLSNVNISFLYSWFRNFWNYEKCLVNYEKCLINHENCLVNYEKCLINYEKCLINYEKCFINKMFSQKHYNQWHVTKITVTIS